jgi:hypothetical protein
MILRSRNLSSFLFTLQVNKSNCMRKLFVIVILIISNTASAQLPEDALRLSWSTPSGTARQQAIGGAMGSLGGDITSTFVNPAGLGFYKTSEVVISPGFRFLTDKSIYRGTNASGNSVTNFNLGASGIVFGYPTRDGNTAAISIAVNRMANFNSNVYYKGQNDYSSFAEQYAIEFANSGLSINDGLGSTQLSYGTRMALYTYLIDTATVNGAQQVIALPLKAGLLNQQSSMHSRGGITEIALGIGSNMHDKFYFGATLGFPIINYMRTLTFTEADATGNTNNDFASSTYSETYTTKGFGLNIKLGAIYKPAEAWRIGAAIHTPSFVGLKDEIHARMATNTEAYAKTISITSDSLDLLSNSSANQIQYNLNSPWKFLLSATYLFGAGVEDVSRQHGFITADAEYVTNRSSFFHPNDEATDDSYFNGVNDAVKASYKSNFNFRMGGEMKFNTIMARLGFAYSTTPYRQSELKANRMFISGGVGYRNKGIFIDLTYVQNIMNDISFPYRLADKANTFATLKDNGGTVLVTVGLKLQ